MTKLTNTQYSINRKTLIDSRLTNSWLKENNIKPESLNDASLLALHATLRASKTLRNQMQYLNNNEIQILNSFLNKVHSNKHITSGLIQKTFYICNYAQRREAKHLKKQFKSVQSGSARTTL